MEENKKKKRNRMKLPNGFGSISNQGSKRRKPFAAYNTVGFDDNGNTIRKYLGSAETWEKAYKLLLDFGQNPYNLDHRNYTLQKVYDLLEPKLLESVEKKMMSESNYKNLKNAYKNHLSKLKNEKILEIKKKQVQLIINESGLKGTGRGYIKNIWTRIILFCVDELEMSIDSNIFDLNVGKKEDSDKHYPF